MENLKELFRKYYTPKQLFDEIIINEIDASKEYDIIKKELIKRDLKVMHEVFNEYLCNIKYTKYKPKIIID